MSADQTNGRHTILRLWFRHTKSMGDVKEVRVQNRFKFVDLNFIFKITVILLMGQTFYSGCSKISMYGQDFQQPRPVKIW